MYFGNAGLEKFTIYRNVLNGSFWEYNDVFPDTGSYIVFMTKYPLLVSCKLQMQRLLAKVENDYL